MGKYAPMQWYDLHDFYTGNSLGDKREKIMDQFSITPEKLQAEILTNPDVHFLYLGMLKFMQEELEYRPHTSGNQLKKQVKALVKQMMMRNEAWSNLVKHEFKSHIRLSMHPSVNNGAKYSFQLIPGKNATKSAWHCVIVDHNGEAITMHKKDAIAAGYRVVEKDGRPYNFVTD